MRNMVSKNWWIGWLGGLLLFGCATQPAPVSAPSAPRPLEKRSAQPLTSQTPLALEKDRQFKQFSPDINDLVMRAFDLVSIGYRYGGNSPSEGFDCSGFVSFLFQEQMDVTLPRSTKDIRYEGKSVDKHDLKTGDLVFFNTQNRPFSHVGVYIGEGRFIHAPRKGAKVRIESMATSYWASRFNGARRVVEPAKTASTQ